MHIFCKNEFFSLFVQKKTLFERMKKGKSLFHFCKKKNKFRSEHNLYYASNPCE